VGRGEVEERWHDFSEHEELEQACVEFHVQILGPYSKKDIFGGNHNFNFLTSW
jgi:hypothetical protein